MSDSPRHAELFTQRAIKRFRIEFLLTGISLSQWAMLTTATSMPYNESRHTIALMIPHAYPVAVLTAFKRTVVLNVKHEPRQWWGEGLLIQTLSMRGIPGRGYPVQ